MSTAPPTSAGTILFYESKGTLLDRLISWFTHSRFVHVAIQISDTEKIEAEGNGVVKTPLVGRSIAARWPYVSTLLSDKDYDAIRLESALNWILSMVGKPYGDSDILTAISEGLPWHSFYTVQWQHYDCSALATQFLIQAGGVDLAQLAQNPHTVTPAMLAKQLGVT